MKEPTRIMKAYSADCWQQGRIALRHSQKLWAMRVIFGFIISLSTTGYKYGGA
jgi:hypothetical protein